MNDGTTAKDTGIARTLTRRRLLLLAAGAAGGALLAACGDETAPTATSPAATSAGGARVVITTPTVAAAAATAPAMSAASAAAAPTTAMTMAMAAPSPSITMMRAELKGKITIARQPASPLSNGKDDPSTVVFQQLIDRYQKEHPGVSMEWIRVPGSSFDELTQWIRTRVSAKNAPTLSGHYDGTTTSQEATNTAPYIALTSYLDKPSPYTNKPWRQDFTEGALALSLGSKKNWYSVPLTRYKAAWLYNKNLWKKAGLTDADEPKTWVDFFKVLDKLKASGTIPIARTGDAFALSHTYWVTLISIGNKAWMELSGGKNFADDATKFKALCGNKWTMDTPHNRKAAEVTKRMFAYWPTGSTTLKAGDIEQLFLTQKAALWQGTPGTQGQTILRRIDEAKAEGLESFDVGAFPTPQPDAETFGEELAKNAGKMADDGENGLAYNIAISDIRQDKDAGAEAIAVDFLQWMTTPEIQAIYVRPSYDLPINPNVKLDDPRLELFNKNPTQLYNNMQWFYGNRPDWLPNFQGYLARSEGPRRLHQRRAGGDSGLHAESNPRVQAGHSLRVTPRRSWRGFAWPYETLPAPVPRPPRPPAAVPLLWSGFGGCGSSMFSSCPRSCLSCCSSITPPFSR